MSRRNPDEDMRRLERELPGMTPAEALAAFTRALRAGAYDTAANIRLHAFGKMEASGGFADRTGWHEAWSAMASMAPRIHRRHSGGDVFEQLPGHGPYGPGPNHDAPNPGACWNCGAHLRGDGEVCSVCWAGQSDMNPGCGCQNPLTGIEAHGELTHALTNLHDAETTTSAHRAAYSAGKARARSHVVRKHGPTTMHHQANTVGSRAKAVATLAQRLARNPTLSFSRLDHAEALAWALRSSGYNADVLPAGEMTDVVTDAPRKVLEPILRRVARNPRKKEPKDSSRGRAADRAAGARWFNSLDDASKWELGDQFVLGTYDWRDWFHDPVSSAFLNGAEEARLNWEVMG